MLPCANNCCPHCGVELYLPASRDFLPTVCGVCKGELHARTNLGPFRLLEFLRRGGLGVVYRAIHEEKRFETEVKVLQLRRGISQPVLDCFRDTALALQRLSHPHCARVDGVGFQADIAYLATESVPGGSLRRLLTTRDRLGLSEVLLLGQQAAAGLKAADSVGVRHPHFTPASVQFCAKGHVKLKGFAAAVLYDDLAGATGVLNGQLSYLAPECLRSEPTDARSDIYALGAVLFQALTGSPPFEAETHPEILLARMESETPRVEDYLPQIERSAAGLLNGMLHPDAHLRIQSWDELLERLASVS